MIWLHHEMSAINAWLKTVTFTTLLRNHDASPLQTCGLIHVEFQQTLILS